MRLGAGVERLERGPTVGRERSCSRTARPFPPRWSSSPSACSRRPRGSRSPTTTGIPTDASGPHRRPGVYAAGDVAQAWHPLLRRPLRVEHWTSAAGQGAAVAHAILGDERPHAALPYFWSDQFGLRLQYVGHAERWAGVELDGEPGSLVARYRDEAGATVAALAVNRPAEVGRLRTELTEALSERTSLAA